MVNTESNLDREGHEHIEAATRQSWTALEYALGLNLLPKIETLYAPDEAGSQATDRRVARGIANLLQRTRGSVEAELEANLTQALGAERRRVTPATPPDSLQRNLEQRSVAVAEGYLRVINSTVQQSDIENLINTLPAAIRPVDGTRHWSPNAMVAIGGGPTNIRVDLNNPVWRTGTEAQIRQRLTNRALGEAGIEANGVPRTYVLKPAEIDAIFQSQNTVVDPNIPVRQVAIENCPNNGERALFDLPGVLRDHPDWANDDLPTLLSQFAALPLLQSYIEIIHVASGTSNLIASLNNSTRNLIIARAFNELGRVNQPIASADHALSYAIAAREPIDTLLAGAADNRELLLALSAIQRDPTTLSALTPDSAEIDRLNRLRTIAESTQSIALDNTPVDLPSEVPANHSVYDINTMINNLSAPGGHIERLNQETVNWNIAKATHETQLQAHGVQVRAWDAQKEQYDNAIQADQRLQDQYQHEQTKYSKRQSAAMKAGMTFKEKPPVPPKLTNPTHPGPKPAEPLPPQFTTITLIAPFARTIHSEESLRDTLNELNTILSQLTAARQTLQRRGEKLASLYAVLSTVLSEHNLTMATTFPSLNVLIDGSVNPPVYHDTQITADLDMSRLMDEVKSGMPEQLRSSAEYATDITALRSQQTQLEGSEAVWAICRRELENQGMRGEQLEKTLQYMRNQLDHTPESARDVEEMANAAFPYEGEAERLPRGRILPERRGPAAKEWEGDRAFRSINWFGLRKVRPNLEEYKTRIFSPQCVGITFEQGESAMSRSVPLPRLIDAYFRTKYLMDLPEDDPRALPAESAEMVQFMRNVYKAILERAQLSLQNSTDATQAELEEMGISPDMTKIQRLRAAQKYLLSGEEAYYAVHKSTIEKLIDRAYRPIKRQRERHDRWVRKPVAAVTTGTKNQIVNRSKNIFKGEGSALNPLTYPARGAKAFWKFGTTPLG